MATVITKDRPSTYDREAIISGFDMLAYAEQHLGGLEQHGDEWKVTGGSYGGLFINPTLRTWNIVSATKPDGRTAGGSAIDLVGFKLYGESWFADQGRERMATAMQTAATWSGVEPTNGHQANGHASKKPSTRNGVASNGHAATDRADHQEKPAKLYSVPNDPPPTRLDKETGKTGRITACHVYRHLDNSPALRIRRYHTPDDSPKGYSKDCIPDRYEPGTGWLGGTGVVRPGDRILYNLPAVVAAVAGGEPVFIVEGENKADALAAIGITATCSLGGAGKWGHTSAEAVAALVGADVVILPDNDEPGRKHADQVTASLLPIAASVRVLILPDLPDRGDVVDWLQTGQQLGAEGAAEALRSMLDELEPIPRPLSEEENARARIMDLIAGLYRPDFDNAPPPTMPALLLNGVRIGSYGNLTVIIAGAGSGKSALCEALGAAALSDCKPFGFEVQTNRPILILDTERTNEDLHRSFLRMHRRASTDQRTAPHDRVISYSLKMAGNVADRIAILYALVDRYKPGMVILDGLADFVNDPNSPDECSPFLNELLASAETHRFAIVGTIHPNPGSDKPRGHIGSDAWRRAEAALYLSNDRQTDIRTLTTRSNYGKNRNDGEAETSFRFDDSEGVKMFVGCATPIRSAKEAKSLEDNTRVACEVFKGRVSFRRGELEKAIAAAEGISEEGGKKRVNTMVHQRIVVKGQDGRYYLPDVPDQDEEGKDPF